VEKGKLLTGFGVKFAFRGHDMHGLRLGPDGWLYFSIGDRSLNVHTPDGRNVTELESGSVLR
jgi:quinoprotein glucose dehydrogenase